MGKLHIADHPLIKDKIAKLRDKKTGAKEFREIAKEVATLLFYDATRELPTKKATVETPIQEAECEVVEPNLAVVPILRAGLGMVDGILSLMPTTKVGHIGIFRQPDTLQPIEYYSKLPPDCADRYVFLTDPMLATGGTANAAITFMKAKGVVNITFLCLLACPNGVRRVQENHPDVNIYAAAIDPILNDHGYIVPGLGDAGDRIFGTK